MYSRSMSLRLKCCRPFSTSTYLNSEKRAVRLVEAGARDGLQNIKQSIPTATKIELIQRLAATGLRDIEATSFVSPKWVPQLADGKEVMQQILPQLKGTGIRLPVLAPNMKGLENAMKSKAEEIVVFASATEAFSKANQNCAVEEALTQAATVTEKALKHNIAVRGVVSCIFADPYSGPTDPSSVLRVVQRLLDMGCYEVSLGDTLGVGTPMDTQILLEALLKTIPAGLLAGHFHDTYGQAVANVVRAYDMGLRTFDSSVAGLGGCPYAPGARGNVATEDIAYTFEKAGIDTGVNLQKLISTGEWISEKLGIPYGSRAGAALSAKRNATKAPASLGPSVKEPSRTWELVEDTGEYSVSKDRHTIKVTLTRERNGNALTDTMVDGLTQLFRRLAQDPSIFHIILAAKGNNLCTGMDLSGGTNTTNVSSDDSYFSKVVDLFAAIDSAPQTTIALIDGPCFGGGVGLGFVCDIRLVSPRARWTLSEVKLGISPAIISKYMVREWGVPFSREAILTGRQVRPEELLRIGAVHGLSSDSEGALEKMLDEKLIQLEKCAPRASTWCKELVNVAWTDPGGKSQDEEISTKFRNMMAPGSEGRFGMQQFQRKVKVVDWAKFWRDSQQA